VLPSPANASCLPVTVEADANLVVSWSGIRPVRPICPQSLKLTFQLTFVEKDVRVPTYLSGTLYLLFWHAMRSC